MTGRRDKSRGRLLRIGAAALLVVLAAVIWNWDAIPDPENWFVDDTKYHAEIVAAARRHGLDPELVRALIFRESRFNARARGSAGEIGLMQVLPSGAAAEWARVAKRARPSGRELFGVELNLEIGCWYLARAIRRWSGYDHGLELALGQYNAGERRAKAWAPPRHDGEVLPRVTIAGTRRYISNIMKRYRKYTESAAAKR